MIYALYSTGPPVTSHVTADTLHTNMRPDFLYWVIYTLLLLGLPSLSLLVYNALHSPAPGLLQAALFGCMLFVTVCLTLVASTYGVWSRLRDAWHSIVGDCLLFLVTFALALGLLSASVLNAAGDVLVAAALYTAEHKPSPMRFGIVGAGRRSVVGSYHQHSIACEKDQSPTCSALKSAPILATPRRPGTEPEDDYRRLRFVTTTPLAPTDNCRLYFENENSKKPRETAMKTTLIKRGLERRRVDGDQRTMYGYCGNPTTVLKA